MKRLQYQKRGDKNFEEFLQQNTKGKQFLKVWKPPISYLWRAEEGKWPGQPQRY